MQPTKPIAGCLGCGCFAPIVIAVILLGGLGALFGNWAAYGASPVSLASDQAAAAAGIPTDYLGFYAKASRQFGVDWQVLAAVGEVESDHGMEHVDCTEGSDGRKGPMQFDADTWSKARSVASLPADADICDPQTSILRLDNRTPRQEPGLLVPRLCDVVGIRVWLRQFFGLADHRRRTTYSEVWAD
jgi:hypothetical protein